MAREIASAVASLADGLNRVAARTTGA